MIAFDKRAEAGRDGGTLPSTQVLSSCALLMVRMHGAKGAGEVLGQGFVDAVLDLGLERVQSALRGQDQAVALSRSELVIVLKPVGSAEDVEKIAQRLLDLIQRAYVVQGQMMYLHAWLGATLAAETGTPYGELLKQAETALRFASLEDSGNITFFHDDMQERLKSQQSLTAELRKALPLRQLEVYYQPQVLLPSCTLIGFEALLRWKHPERGWISPVDFIPLAEEIGIIGNIGSWVLRTACRQAALLPDGLTIAVNASPLQLKNGSLLGAVTDALSSSRLSPARLEVEITEGVLLERSGVVRSTLDNLHGMGVKLAIDDFGTGYSSLGQLANLPFDCIKIDRSLVGTGVKNRAIIRAIAMLGKGLGMSTLIEGIESDEELGNAISDGCTLAQGYLFGKAIPATELEGVLARLSVPRVWSLCG